MPLEPSYGEKAVGLSFNPSGDPEVDKIKRKFAEIIDFCDSARKGASPERARLYSIAITEAQTSQMWCIKGITWKDE